jgi:hypothetical protein
MGVVVLCAEYQAAQDQLRNPVGESGRSDLSNL